MTDLYGKCMREIDRKKPDGSFTYAVWQDTPGGMRCARDLDEHQANKLVEDWDEEGRLHLMSHVWII